MYGLISDNFQCANATKTFWFRKDNEENHNKRTWINLQIKIYLKLKTIRDY